MGRLVITKEAWYREADERALRRLEQEFKRNQSPQTAEPLIQAYQRAGNQKGVESVWAALDLQEIARLPPHAQPQWEFAYFSMVMEGEDPTWGPGFRLAEDGPFHVDYDFNELLHAIDQHARQFHDATLDGMETLLVWALVEDYDDEGVGEKNPYGVDADIDEWIAESLDTYGEFPGTYRWEYHLYIGDDVPRDLILRLREYSRSKNRRPSLARDDDD